MITNHRSMLATAAAALALASSLAAAVETYETAVISEDGQLRIVTTDHHEIVPQKEKDEVGFAKPAISADRKAVGWIGMYGNCSTSYPLPVKLFIRTAGAEHALTGIGLPIWRWCFEDGGKRVAFEQEPPHGEPHSYYELHDVASGKLLADYEPKASSVAPPWVAVLDAQK